MYIYSLLVVLILLIKCICLLSFHFHNHFPLWRKHIIWTILPLQPLSSIHTNKQTEHLWKIIKAHQVIITDSKLQLWTKAIYHNWLTGTKLLTVNWLIKILILFLKTAQISNFGITDLMISHNLSITSILEPHERYKWVEFLLRVIHTLLL